MITQEFQVAGMTCGHCVHAVTTELSKLDGVENVSVDLATGKVTVQSANTIPVDAAAAAIDEAGYELSR